MQADTYVIGSTADIAAIIAQYADLDITLNVHHFFSVYNHSKVLNRFKTVNGVLYENNIWHGILCRLIIAVGIVCDECNNTVEKYIGKRKLDKNVV